MISYDSASCLRRITHMKKRQRPHPAAYNGEDAPSNQSDHLRKGIIVVPVNLRKTQDYSSKFVLGRCLAEKFLCPQFRLLVWEERLTGSGLVIEDRVTRGAWHPHRG